MAKSQEKSFVLDIQTLLIPGSIVFAGLMISISVFWGFQIVEGSIVRAQESGTNVLAETGGDAEGLADNAEAPAEVPTPTEEATTSIDDDPYLGDRESATVAVVEFTDLECPYCSRHHEQTFDQIIENYVDGGDVIYVTRDLPLSFHDPAATKEAIAAECVHDLGNSAAYYSFIDEVFTTSAGNGAGLSDSQLATLASNVGVDKDGFENCLKDERFAEEVASDAEAAASAGITGTPGFVVGRLNADGSVEGIRIAGAYPYQTFADAIEQYL